MTIALEHLAVAESALARLRAELTAVAADPAPQPPQPTPESPNGLADPAGFFAYVRARPPLGPTLSQGEVDGCTRILAACAAERFPASWAAYVLATAVHETAGTLRPLREYGKGAGRPYGKPGRNGGQIPYGRGDVQLTWDQNYERADRELDLGGRLIANYDLALEPAVSARIIVRGMREGWFTGKALRTYLPEIADAAQFKNARRIVNGTDKAELIAGYAVTFQDALQAGGWR